MSRYPFCLLSPLPKIMTWDWQSGTELNWFAILVMEHRFRIVIIYLTDGIRMDEWSGSQLSCSISGYEGRGMLYSVSYGKWCTLHYLM